MFEPFLSQDLRAEIESFRSVFRCTLLELSPFAVKLMFWSCVNQSDYKKFYTQFWLWPGLINAHAPSGEPVPLTTDVHNERNKQQKQAVRSENKIGKVS